MILFDGITLNENMVWKERYQPSKVAQSVRRTLGGRPFIYVGALQAGENITLEATVNYGWLTKTVVDQLMSRAANATGIYVLNFDSVNYNVMFRHVDAPALELEPLIPRVSHESGDFFIGQLKLITV
jgi:hypothetical protein